MGNNKIDNDVIFVVYSLMLKHNLTAMNIYDMSMNDRIKLEILILSCASTDKLKLAAEDYISLMPRVTMFLTKYCGALK